MLVCDVSAGSVVISGSNVRECNGTISSIALNGPLVIAGSTTTNRVVISDAEVTVRLSNVVMNSLIPFVCNKSSVAVWTEGANVVRAADDRSSGIECTSESNMSLFGLRDGSLRAIGGKYGAGPDSLCNSVRIENGSYDAEGGAFGTGIGSGYSSFRNGTSRVNFVTIVDGNVMARGGYGGSGIGSGYGEYGTSSVMNLTILNGNIERFRTVGSSNGRDFKRELCPRPGLGSPPGSSGFSLFSKIRSRRSS
jgi:hypothetical protein